MKKKVYAVRNGRKTGLFMSWDDCKKQVDAFPGARYKSFTDADEAWKWLNGEDVPSVRKPTKSRTPAMKSIVAERALAADDDQDSVIYTDGSCLRNPDGPGGWAVVARNVATGEVTELSDGHPSTTNNRMELQAAIMALRFAPEGTKVALYTDSQYLKNGITKWMVNWKRRGWKKADGQPVLNQGQWMELDKLYGSHKVTFHWVKGHVGVALNERCDQLAKAEAMKYR